AAVLAEMDATYGKSKACDPAPGAAAAKGARATSAPRCRDLLKLEDVLAKSRDPRELLAAWRGWHDAAGHAIKPLFERFVPLANAGARGIGFRDVGAMWRASYDMPPDAFAAEVERLWGQVAPLYEQLHCYARRRLNRRY